VTRSEQLLIQRLLDGELPEAEAAALRERLKSEPALRRLMAEQRGVTRWFEAVRNETTRPDAGPAPHSAAPGGPRDGFSTRVLEAIRSPDATAAASASVRFARRIALAAAFLMAVSVLWALALSDRGSGRTLDASPDEVRQAVERVERTELPPEARAALSSGRTPASPRAGGDSRPAGADPAPAGRKR
jgi:anti-sigma factor RsiW